MAIDPAPTQSDQGDFPSNFRVAGRGREKIKKTQSGPSRVRVVYIAPKYFYYSCASMLSIHNVNEVLKFYFILKVLVWI